MLAPLLLGFGITLLAIAGAVMGWQPSQIGGPADWLDDHLYAGPVHWIAQSSYWPYLGTALYLLAIAVSFGGYLLAVKRALPGRGGPRNAPSGQGAFDSRGTSGAGAVPERPRPGTGPLNRQRLWIVLVVQALLSVWLALQPYGPALDIFSYDFYAHIFAWYHANPYVAIPRDFPFDPLFSSIFWKDQPSNYGPLWTYLSALAPLLSGLQIGTNLFILRAIAALAALGATPFLWSALGRLRPEKRLAGTILFAWNPLLLVEAAAAGHNDVVMVFFLVLAIWLLSRGRFTSSIAALILATLVKYVALMLVPLFLVVWWRERREHPLRIGLKAGAVSLTLLVAGFVPVYAGPATFGILGFGTNSLAYDNSPLELAFREVRIVLGEPIELAELPLHYRGYWIAATGPTILWSEPNDPNGYGTVLPRSEPLLVVEIPWQDWLHVYGPRLGTFGYVKTSETHAIPAPAGLQSPGTTLAVLEGVSLDPIAQRSNLILRIASLLLFTPVYVLGLRRSRERRAMFRWSITILMFYLVVVQSWFWPWYLLWALPFAALVPETTGARILVVLTATTSILNAQPNISPSPILQHVFEARMVVIEGLPFLLILLVWWTSRGRPLPRWRGGTRVVRLGAVLRSATSILARSATVGAVVLVLVARGTVGSLAPVPAGATGDDMALAFADAQRDYALGDYQSTVDRLNQVLTARPRDSDALRLRVVANAELRRYAATIPDLDRLLADDPDNVDLLVQRGTMYARVERRDRALSDFQRVILLAPESPLGFQLAGQVKYFGGQLVAAKTLLGVAQTLAPDDPEIALQLADVLASDHDLAGALEMYNLAARLSPSSAQAYANRAALLHAAGITDATVPDLQKVLLLSSDVEQHRWAARLLNSIDGDSAGSPVWTE